MRVAHAFRGRPHALRPCQSTPASQCCKGWGAEFAVVSAATLITALCLSMRARLITNANLQGSLLDGLGNLTELTDL
jgi:hypothetical protein